MKILKYFIIFISVIVPLSILYSCKKNDQLKFNLDNTYPWCIVAFDSMNRIPGQRIQMLNDFGFSKYAYDWRDHHLDEMQEELTLAKEAGIQVISSWLWLNAKRDSLGKLNPANESMFDNLKSTETETEIWLSFSNNYFEELNQVESLQKARDLVEFVCKKAHEINCTVALYNHTGWFGKPHNQVEIIKTLPQYNLKIVYNFHHGQDDIDNFPEIVSTIKPYLSAVNLNGMKKEGPKILPIGQGDHEYKMIEILLNNGFNGPWGVLGHVEDADVKYILEQNLEGLKNIFR